MAHRKFPGAPTVDDRKFGYISECYLIALTRFESRDTLRAAEFLWTTPFCAPRMSSGSAAFSAASAADLSPEAMASSTLRTEERNRLKRFLLMTARRAATRVAFFAELVFAMKSHPESWNLSILVQCKNAAARF